MVCRKPLNKEELVFYYTEKQLSIRETAKQLGVSHRHVNSELHRYNIQRRTKEEAITLAHSKGVYDRYKGKTNPNYRHGRSGRYGKYGITEEDFLCLLRNQGYKCCICQKDISVSSSHIDHCHTHNHIRGILCPDCNVGLGFFKDNIESLVRAAEYLERARWKG